MKNGKLVLFLSLLLILLIPSMAMCQEAAQAVITSAPGLFGKIGSWIQSNAIEVLVVFVSGIAAKHGWTQYIKAFANKGAVVTKQISELFADSSAFLSTLDNAIKDDGTIQGNSVQDVLSAGKTVIAEGKDVMITIKPKT